MWRRGPGPGTPTSGCLSAESHLSSAARGGEPEGDKRLAEQGSRQIARLPGPKLVGAGRPEQPAGREGPPPAPPCCGLATPPQGLLQVLGEPASCPRTRAPWGSNAGPAQELEVTSVLWLQMRKRAEGARPLSLHPSSAPRLSRCLPSCWGDPQPACPYQAPSPLGPN